jgi:hypothetical protein
MSLFNAVRQVAYDNPSATVRQAAALAANSAGSASTSGKFIAWAALTVYGVTFFTTTAGTSTYSYNGTATNPGTVMSALIVQNTNTTGTAVTLGTTTIGPFIIGGTSTAGQGNVGGTSGGIAGGYQGPYALNTLGGTNTSQVVGLTTYTAGYPGNASVGFGGIQLNPGDTIQFVNGTDATAVTIPQLQYSLTGVTGNILS